MYSILRFVGKELEICAQQKADYNITVIDEHSKEDLHPFHGNITVQNTHVYLVLQRCGAVCTLHLLITLHVYKTVTRYYNFFFSVIRNMCLQCTVY